MLKKKGRRSVAPEAPTQTPRKTMGKGRGKGQGKNRVRFAEATETRVFERKTLGEKLLAWYSARDYQAMKRENQNAIHCAKLGAFVESEHQSIRGLERFVWFSPHEKQQRRRTAITRILNEQRRQKELGINDPNMIKVLSTIYSNWERDRALELAAGDAIEVLAAPGQRQGPNSDTPMVIVAACRGDVIETVASGFDSRSVWL